MANKDFFIPQVEDDEIEEKKQTAEQEVVFPKKEKTYESEGFISSLYGRNVKNDGYYPDMASGNTKSRRYETLKDNRTDYSEFDQYIINKQPSQTKNTNNQNETMIQEVIVNNNIDEFDPYNYSNEPVKQDEFVSVKQPQNSNINNNYNNSNQYLNTNDNIEEEYNNSYNESDELDEVNESDSERIMVIDNPTPIPPRNNSVPKQGNTKTEIKPKKRTKYYAPPIDILNVKPDNYENNDSETLRQRDSIDLTLKQFDIGGHVVNFTKGPTVTQFEVQLDDGVRNQKIVPIQSNLQGNLKATSLRMQIPIPGKATIGIEVPNAERETVFFGDMIKNPKFLKDGNPLNVVLGLNIDGEPVYLDIPKMPHGLIAGCTGSGKSVCINAIIASILYKAHPDDVKLVLVDPKRVEFARYAGIPHLASPIITEPKMANAALKWVVDEMENRYRLMEATGVSKYTEYLEEEKHDARLKHIPYIVIIIDELADLMMTSGPEVEESIMRITQKARAAGIHLIVATQRPSVDIISGTIKTNIPTRIAFKVKKSLDSTIIIDHVGAEKLLGDGDMLYTDDRGVENRIQGAFISGGEIKRLVNSLGETTQTEFLFTEEDLKKKTTVDHSNDAFEDELFEDIARYVVENNTASINLLTKKFGCGFSRIQAIIIKLGELGVVSENLGSRAREVLVNIDELEEILNNI